MIRAIAAGLILAGCTVAYEREGTLHVVYDEGGIIETRAAKIEQLRRDGTRVVIGDGVICVSACTMYLALENTCVHPGAMLGFHGAIDLAPGSGPSADEYNRILATYYPQPIRDWFFDSGAYRYKVIWKTLKGSEAIAMGVPACNGEAK